MTRLLIIIAISIPQTAWGQIFNSSSGDSSGLYYYSVDTVIRSLKNERPIDRIVLKADRPIIQSFPETIQGKRIVKLYHGVTSKKRAIVLGDVVFLINGLSIIRNQITISIGTYEMTKHGLHLFAQGVYILYFKYVPDTDTYSLTNIKSGYTL